MGASKIVDEGEVLRWFEEGLTYAQMQEQYREKYNIETAISMWSNFRRRRGLDRRFVRDDDMIPWAVKPEHRYRHAVKMLRAAARVNAGVELDPNTAEDFETWSHSLQEQDAVVHYDPETDAGFFYVPRRTGVDEGYIREPERKTARLNADR